MIDVERIQITEKQIKIVDKNEIEDVEEEIYEEETCMFCNTHHEYSEDECLEINYIEPEILFIETEDKRVGNWSNPEADFIMKACPWMNVPDYGDEELKEKRGLINLRKKGIRCCSFPSISIRYELGEEEKSLTVVSMVSPRQWEKLRAEEGLCDYPEKGFTKPAFSFLATTTHDFLCRYNENHGFKAGVDLFIETKYGKKLNKYYDFEYPTFTYYTSVGGCLLHKDHKFFEFDSERAILRNYKNY